MQYGLFDPKTEYVAKYIEERTGFHVEYELLPAENADEKLNLIQLDNMLISLLSSLRVAKRSGAYREVLDKLELTKSIYCASNACKAKLPNQ